MRNRVLRLLVAMLGISWISCRHHEPQQVAQPDSLNEHLINANKIMLKDERKEIEDFIVRHQWKMETTGTGLHYEIYSHGSGKKAELQKEASIAYTVYLLDGTKCYAADENHPLKISLGHGEQTRGLEEGVLMMREGDHARLVVPSHLGYGRPGDGNLVPGNSALYYDVALLKVTSQ